MENFKIELPEVIFGRSIKEEVPRVCEGLGKRAFIVTGKASSQNSGALDCLLSALSQIGKEIVTFSIQGEPSAEDVDRAREAARGADFVVGLGGGSVLDVAKATAGLFYEEKPSVDFLFGEAEISHPPIPSLALPTTAGTGSEVTRVSVLIAERKGERIKTSIHHSNLLPYAAVLDPSLTLTCPPSLTASAGSDALSHCIESFFSLSSNPLSDAIAMQGIALIMNNLRRAVEIGDYESREAMLLGSLLGGISLSLANLGAVHGLAHSLGALKGVPHGVACGIFLPPVLRFNLAEIEDKLKILARYLGLSPDSFVEEVADLLSAVGIPHNLREVNVRKEEAEKIVQGCSHSHSLRYNPKPVSPSDLLSIVNTLL